MQQLAKRMRHDKKVCDMPLLARKAHMKLGDNRFHTRAALVPMAH